MDEYYKEILTDLLALIPADASSARFEALCNQHLIQSLPMCDGFEMGAGQDSLQHALPKARLDSHAKHFLLFGQATHSGSGYAFFRPKDGQNLEQWPVVVFGDEGGALVLAKNLDDFLRFLALNAAPYVGMDHSTDTPVFELSPEEDSDLQSYAQWLQSHCGLTPVTSVAQAQREIIEPANAAYQAQLDAIVQE